jgi:oligopeptidase A
LPAAIAPGITATNAGIENEDKVRELGLKFRDTVLGLGGSKHPAEVYRMFRGRDASTEALLRHSGLKN